MPRAKSWSQLLSFSLTVLLGFALGLLLTSAAQADTLVVTNTDDSGPGSLRQAIADAQPGDTVEFALSYPATITLTSGELSITKSLTITGPGPDLLAVSANRASRVLRVDNPDGPRQIDVGLSGLTIHDGHADNGGGLWNDEYLMLEDVSFCDNEAIEDGGGMYGAASGPVLTNVAFKGNRAGGGGGGLSAASPAKLVNVVFLGNSAGYGGGMDSWYGDPELIQVTFAGNRAVSGGALSNCAGCQPIIQNSILWENRADSGEQISNSPYGGYPIISHSIVQGSGGSGDYWNLIIGVDGGGNLDADPLFVASVDAKEAPTTGGDVRLRLGSPAVDSGDNSLLPPGVTDDLDGEPRVVGYAVDMGAYELQPGLYLRKTSSRDWARPGQTITYSLNVANTFTETVMTGGVVADNLPPGLDFAGPISLDPADVGTVGTAPPSLVTDLTIQPGQVITLSFPVTVQAEVTPGIAIANIAAVSSSQVITPQTDVHQLQILDCESHLTVTSEADDGPDSLRQAIARACPGGGIDFALTYPATITLTTGELVITNSLTITGPGPALLAICGNHTSRVLRIDRWGMVRSIGVGISGLTIAHGSASGGAGLWNDESLTLTDMVFRGNSGSGLFSVQSDPVLTDVIFDGNRSPTGGGMYNVIGSVPKLTRVTFRNNVAIRSGGGMYNALSKPTLTDVTFEGNHAEVGGGFFGSHRSSPILTNVIFRGNWADLGGGMMAESPTLINVTFSGNAAGSGGGMYTDGSPTLTNVTFSGNSASYKGGGLYSDAFSAYSIENSILWGNRADHLGSQIYNHLDAPTITHSIVQDSGGSGPGWDSDLGIDLGGNLDLDPLFVEPVDPLTAPTTTGDVRLQTNSPAINAGANELVPPWLTIDLDGNRRIVLGVVDMGAYEWQLDVAFYGYLPVIWKPEP